MVDMLNKLKSLQKNIKVAIIGTGSAGKGLVYQCSITPGIDCLAISDVKINKDRILSPSPSDFFTP